MLGRRRENHRVVCGSSPPHNPGTETSVHFLRRVIARAFSEETRIFCNGHVRWQDFAKESCREAWNRSLREQRIWEEMGKKTFALLSLVPLFVSLDCGLWCLAS